MIPLPIRDDNPTVRKPVLIVVLITVNVLVWLAELQHGLEPSTFEYGAIPSLVFQRPFTVVTSMFMHGSWLHLIGNMWFLWIFGDNLEDRLGPVRFAIFYLLCGLAAAGAQIVASPGSQMPMVGASGAIAGVMGGYIILYPHARVKCLWILVVFITTIHVPAWLLLGVWFLSQFAIPQASGIAWMAHVGGFVTGVALVKLFVRSEAGT